MYKHHFILAPVPIRTKFKEKDAQVCPTCNCIYFPSSELYFRSGQTFHYPVKCIDEEIENQKTID